MKGEYKTPVKGKKGPNNLQGQNLSKLENVRVIQKYLVYVIGLSSTLANKDVILFIKK